MQGARDYFEVGHLRPLTLVVFAASTLLLLYNFFFLGSNTFFTQLYASLGVAAGILYLATIFNNHNAIAIVIILLFTLLLINFAIFFPNVKHESFLGIIASFMLFFRIKKRATRKKVLIYIIVLTLLSQFYEVLSSSTYTLPTPQNIYDQYFVFFFIIIYFIVFTAFFMKFESRLRDIKSTEKKLEKTEYRYKKLVENIPLNVLHTNLQGKRIYGTKNSAKLFGNFDSLSDDELDSFSMLSKRVHKEDLPSLQAALAKVASEGGTQDIRVRGVKDDGKIFYLAGGVTALFDTEMKPEGFILAYYDETNSVLANQRIAESEKKYKSLIQSSKSIVLLLDDSMEVLLSSPFAETRFGKLTGKNISQIFDEEARKDFLEDVELLRNGVAKANYYYQCKNLDGEVLHIEGSIALNQIDENTREFICFYNDVTERELAIKEAAEAQEKYKQFFDTAPVGITVGADNKLLSANPFFCEMIGYSQEELLTEGANATLHPDDIHIVREAVSKLEERANENLNIQFRMIHKNGEVVFGSAVIAGRYDENGKYVENLFVVSNLTDLVSTQKQLINKSAELDSFFNISEIGIYKGQNGYIQAVNPYLLRRLQYQKEDMIGKHILEFCHPDEQEYLLDRLSAMIEQRDGAEDAVKAKVRDKNGDYISFYVKSAAKLDDAGEYIEALVTLTDITELEEANKKAKNSEAILRSTLEAISEGIIAIDPQNNIIAINSKAKKEFKLFAEVDLQKANNLSQVVPADLLESWHSKYFRKVFSGKHFSYRVDRKVQDIQYYHENIYTPIKDENDEVIGLVELSKDLTEILSKEKEINTSRQRMQDVFNNELLGITYFDVRNSQLIDCNQAMVRFYGYDKKSQFLKADRSKLNPQLQLDGRPNEDFFQEIIEDTVRIGQTSYTFKALTKAGKVKYGLGASFQDTTDPNIIIFFTQDITERVSAELRLGHSEAKFRKLFENNQFGIATLNAEGLSLRNQAFYKIFGLSEASLLEKDFFSCFHEEDIALVHKNINLVKDKTSDQVTFEVRFVNQLTGITGYVIINVTRLGDVSTESDLILTFAEFTQRKYAELELKRSENRYRNLLNVIPNGLGIMTFSGNCIFISDKGQRILSPYCKRLFSISIQDLVDAQHKQKLNAILEDILKTEEERKGIIKFVGDDGQSFYLESQFSIMKDEIFKQSILWIFEDVSDKMN